MDNNIVKLLSIICMIMLATAVQAQGQKAECTWWVSYNGNKTSDSCSSGNMCTTLFAALSQVEAVNTTLCGDSDNRYIYIVSSSTSSYKGSKNVGVRFPDLTANETYTLFIQAVDMPSDVSAVTLPLPQSATNAVFDAEGDNWHMMITSGDLTVSFAGVTFQNGIPPVGIQYDAPIIITGSIKYVIFTQCLFKNNTGNKYGALYWSPIEGGEITNCEFTGNTAKTGYGGGVYVGTSFNTWINDTKFTSNNAVEGGGIYVPALASPLINRCTFTSNNAVEGGGIYVYTRANPMLSSCTFTSNTAEAGGGMYLHSFSRTIGQTWDLLVFVSNKASKYGGAIYDFGSAASLQNFTFTSNTATESGGAIAFFSSVTVVAGATFTSNNAVNGGAVWVSDDVPNESQLLIKESAFNSNSASLGGALYCNLATARMNANNTFTSNVATSNSSTNIDYCTSTCLTAAKDCGCINGCGLPPAPTQVITDKRETKIAIAIFLPVTAILLGVVFFLLWKTNEKAKLRKPENLSYDEIRLTPTNMYEKQVDESEQL